VGKDAQVHAEGLHILTTEVLGGEIRNAGEVIGVGREAEVLGRKKGQAGHPQEKQETTATEERRVHAIR
jgi:hypothetical protein